MGQRTDELRRDIEGRRAAISHTVDEIENRVHPGHVAARNTYRMRRRISEWKDTIMGSDDDAGWSDSAGGFAETVADSVKGAPDAVRGQARGNPIAAGVIAMGAGALVASLLPETRTERRIVQKVEPELEAAAAEVGDAGRRVAEDVGEVAREGMSHVVDSARSAGEEVVEEAKEAGERVSGNSSDTGPEAGNGPTSGSEAENGPTTTAPELGAYPPERR